VRAAEAGNATNVATATVPPATNAPAIPPTNALDQATSAGTNAIGVAAVTTETNLATTATNQVGGGTNATATQSNLVFAVIPPEAALTTFRAAPGFRVELVAAEPLVESPVAGAFDEFGRLYVVEMRDFPAQRAARLGRVRLLEDTNDDGRFDKATVFADNLPWPSAIACGNGGVFVGATPDIWFFKDNDRDGVSDERRVVLTGFASDYAPFDEVKLDVQALMNSFNWGLDNRIHGVTSFNGGRIAVSGGGLLDLQGKDFSFGPLGLVVDVEAGGAQSGMSFDGAGHKFVSSARDHLQAIVYDERYAIRNPFYAMPPARISIAADGPAAPLFRLTPGPGYFGMASGLVIYRGNAFPTEYLEDAFVADMAANVVHRKKILWPNIVPVARRPSATERHEFLASTDPMFRPVQLLNGPDGALYVIDLHRRVIVHPWSLDEIQARQVDWNRDINRGRIFRVLPQGFTQPVIDKLGFAALADLVATLESNNAWHRETAARLLLERREPRSVTMVERLLVESKSPLCRLQALYTLDGLGALQLPQVLRTLSDPDGRVREQALRLVEKFIPPNAPPPQELLAVLSGLTGDPAVRVRFQLAFTLGQLPPPLRLPPLAALVRRDLGNPWMHAAILGSLADGAEQMFLGFAGTPAMTGSPAGQDFLMQLATMVGIRNQSAEVQRVMTAALSLRDDTAKLGLARALNDGLEKAGTSWQSINAGSNGFTFRVLLTAILSGAATTDAQRLQAVPLIASDDYPNAAAALLPVLGGRQGQVLQSAVIRAMDRFSGTQVAADLVDRWRALTPALRVELIEMLLTRPERASVLLAAMERKFVLTAELNSVQMQRLRDYPDPSIRHRAMSIFGQAVNPNRSRALATFAASAKILGNPSRGQALFRARCIGCHRLGGEGGNYGPDLSGVRGAGRQWLLTNIVAPNRYVAQEYAIHRVMLKNGQILEGLLRSQNPASIVLRRPTLPDAYLLRLDIQSIENLGVSAMPDGLEWGLTQLNMSDLLDYLLNAR
jgi:putative membrane-bound dehydrogenase-like protein